MPTDQGDGKRELSDGPRLVGNGTHRAERDDRGVAERGSRSKAPVCAAAVCLRRAADIAGQRRQRVKSEEKTMNVEVMQAQLRRLMLHTAAREMEAVLAKHKKSVSLEWVSELLEREIDSRKANGIQNRIKRAAFPEVTTLEEFDWEFNGKIERGRIEE